MALLAGAPGGAVARVSATAAAPRERNTAATIVARPPARRGSRVVMRAGQRQPPSRGDDPGMKKKKKPAAARRERDALGEVLRVMGDSATARASSVEAPLDEERADKPAGGRGARRGTADGNNDGDGGSDAFGMEDGEKKTPTPAYDASGAEKERVVKRATERKSSDVERSQDWSEAAQAREVGRAAQYMRDLISRQVKSNNLSRAGSLADSTVLRRKGRLKEQDPFIEFIVDLFKTHETEEALAKAEKWLDAAIAMPPTKRRFANIYRQVPKLGYFFHALPLSKALAEYDEFCALTKRKYVRPNFAEVRHIINIAQVHASAREVKLVTFDADGTLYADGKHFEEDNQMIDKIIQLMEVGVHVAIVTAAGYPGDAKKFEQRLRGLLDSFKSARLSADVRKRFHVMGGECNYLLEVNDEYELEFVPNEKWRDVDSMTREMYWFAQSEEGRKKVDAFLDRAEKFLTDEAEHLQIDVDVMRKEYAVGVLPRSGTVYENLEEISIGAMIELSDAEVPYCAFNGGNDVFVDVGNKNIGLVTLMKFLGYEGHQTLHVGDRFTSTGNDTKVRDACSILWVASPDETTFFMRLLYRDIVNMRVL